MSIIYSLIHDYLIKLLSLVLVLTRFHVNSTPTWNRFIRHQLHHLNCLDCASFIYLKILNLSLDGRQPQFFLYFRFFHFKLPKVVREEIESERRYQRKEYSCQHSSKLSKIF